MPWKLPSGGKQPSNSATSAVLFGLILLVASVDFAFAFAAGRLLVASTCFELSALTAGGAVPLDVVETAALGARRHLVHRPRPARVDLRERGDGLGEARRLDQALRIERRALVRGPWRGGRRSECAAARGRLRARTHAPARMLGARASTPSACGGKVASGTGGLCAWCCTWCCSAPRLS